jgi:hypothetical protein
MGHTRGKDNLYHIKGKTYEILCGSRAQVLHGTAYKTSGGLTKEDLLQNKNGRIVSKKKHNMEKKYKRLLKHGYTAKKGHFGPVKISRDSRSSRGSRSSRSMSRGGMSPSTSMSSIKNTPHMKPTTIKGGFKPNHSSSTLQPAMIGGKCGAMRGGSALKPASFTRGGKKYRGGALAPLPMTPLSDASKGIGTNVPYPSQNPLTRALGAS